MMSERPLPNPDAVICSYPKSGRTWLAWSLASYMNHAYRLGIDLNFATLYELIPADGAMTSVHPAYVDGRMPRLRQDHTADPAKYRRVIFLVRHPLDTLVSYYFHDSKQLGGSIGAIHGYIRRRIVEWVDYMNHWVSLLPQIPSLVLSYENRRRLGGADLRQVLKFMGVDPIDDAALFLAQHESTFSRMQAKELHGPRIPGVVYDVADVEARRVRRAKIGGWREHLRLDDYHAVQSCISERGTAALYAFLMRYGYGTLGEKAAA